MTNKDYIQTGGNLWALLNRSLVMHENRVFWICRDHKPKRIIKYHEIRDAALNLAHYLRQQGINNRDTISIAAPNGPHWSIAALATWKLGACIAPIYISNSDYEIAAQLEAIKPRIVLTHKNTIQYPRLQAIQINLDKQAINTEGPILAPAKYNDEAIRIYTSGSTDTPKVVRLSHANIMSNLLASNQLFTFKPTDRFISLLPYPHALGITNLLLPMYNGCSIVIPKKIAAAEILATLAEEKITLLIAVPRLFRNLMFGLEKKFTNSGRLFCIYRSMLKRLPPKLRPYFNGPIRKKFGGNLNAWVSGGSHLDGQITRYYHDLGLPLRQGYGLTETSPLVSVQEHFDQAVDSVGRPVSGVTVKIHRADKSGNGELWVKGSNVMLGYADPEQTAEVMVDGWFRTGDIAQLDPTGRIILTGRCKRLIVTEAGKNVYPEKLETWLERNSTFKEAAVLERDMKPVCVVAIDGDNKVQRVRECLKRFNSIVSKHNQIFRFAIVEELPKTPLGKIALQKLPQLFDCFEIK